LGTEGCAVGIETVPELDVPRTHRTVVARPKLLHATVETAEIAWLQIARITAARHKVVHAVRSSATPAMAIVLQVTGKSIIEQQGRTARLTPGHWSICDSAQTYTLTSPAASQRLLLLIPHDCLDDNIERSEIIARSFSGTTGVGRLVFATAGWLIDELATLHAERADMLAKTITQIINLAIQEKRGRRSAEPPRGTLGDRVRAYVADHLRDPHLSLDSIAKNLNSSKRSLHRAVSSSNGSIHDLIWHQRLERCRRDLLDPSQSRQSIAEIARSWGFKNFTHFSQAFRDRFGVSARETRRALFALSD
jgi:AraC-like DNA-binding protein